MKVRMLKDEYTRAGRIFAGQVVDMVPDMAAELIRAGSAVEIVDEPTAPQPTRRKRAPAERAAATPADPPETLKGTGDV